MNFAVVRIVFENEDNAPQPDRKELQAFIERLKAKFRVVAMLIHAGQDDGESSFAYTSLAHSQEALSKQLDAISAFCEEQGFGRIADESVLMDDIDTIGDTDEFEGDA